MDDDTNILAKAVDMPGARISRLALASYVSAILTIAGLLLENALPGAICLFLFFMPAIAAGHLARRAFRKRPGFYRRQAMATFGLVIGYLGLIMSALAIGAILTGADGSVTVNPIE